MVSGKIKEKVNKKKTYIKSLDINNFRLFHNVSIDIGSNLTMISGMNGVGKSTILGILAQVCSFSTVYIPADNGFKKIDVPQELKTVYGKSFTSKFKDHFMISKKYDVPQHEYEALLKINDAQEEIITEAYLRGTHRENNLRFVLRKEKTITKNTSRNITFPTIFLSNQRLMPFVSRKENLDDKIFSDDEKKLFQEYSDMIFIPTRLSQKRHISSNRADISSSVLTSTDYDIESASTGEDNIGQILAALISFVRLSKKWKYYKGGLLLIDEIENSLFPRAQIGLLNLLRKFSSEYNVQIVFTTHSPTIMSKMMEFKDKSVKSRNTYDSIGINFLSDKFGNVENYKNASFDKMIAALEVRPIKGRKTHKIKCYCEDTEGYLFLKSLLQNKVVKQVKLMFGITLGSENFIQLAKKKIPEFAKTSIIILDGDMKSKITKNLKNFLSLPSTLPPDQLMFKLLDDTPASDKYWKIDPDSWNRRIFDNDVTRVEIKNHLIFDEEKGIYRIKKDTNSNKPVREYFKNWFNSNYATLKQGKTNPIKKLWIPKHKEELGEFNSNFLKIYEEVYSQTYYLS